MKGKRKRSAPRVKRSKSTNFWHQGWVRIQPTAITCKPIELSEPDAWETPVEHWDMDSIKTAARMAASRCRGLPYSPEGIWDLAWEGVALAVAEDPHASWRDVVGAGARTARVEVRETLRHNGARHDGDSNGARFQAYWLDWQSCEQEAADQCTEGIALGQVMSALPDEDRSTLLAWTTCEDMGGLADVLGVSRTVAAARLRRARASALDLLYDTEAPPPLGRLPIRRRTISDTCPEGHPIDGRSADRRRGRQIRYCKTCRAERSRNRYQREKDGREK